MTFGLGETNGIIDYNGNSWHKSQVPNSANIQLLTLANDSTIYSSAYSDFGYLKSDLIGQIKYRSIKPFLDNKYQDNFGEMWHVVASSAGIFFKTKDRIIKSNGYTINVIENG